MFTARIRLITLSSLFLFFSSAAYFSCIKDNCGNINCLNSGTCVDGFCSCPVGYSGPQCDTIWNTKFLGAWRNMETYTDSLGQHVSLYRINIRPGYIAGSFLVDSLLPVAARQPTTDSLICVIKDFRSFVFTAQYRNDSTFYLSAGSGVINGTNDTISATRTYTNRVLQRTSTMIWTR